MGLTLTMTLTDSVFELAALDIFRLLNFSNYFLFIVIEGFIKQLHNKSFY